MYLSIIVLRFYQIINTVCSIQVSEFQCSYWVHCESFIVISFQGYVLLVVGSSSLNGAPMAARCIIFNFYGTGERTNYDIKITIWMGWKGSLYYLVLIGLLSSTLGMPSFPDCYATFTPNK